MPTPDSEFVNPREVDEVEGVVEQRPVDRPGANYQQYKKVLVPAGTAVDAHSGAATDAHSAHSGAAVDAHSAHSGTAVDAHGVTQPSAHSNHAAQSHDTVDNIPAYFQLAFIQKS